jgi:hydrogenase nickel incorporation protein HypB
LLGGPGAGKTSLLERYLRDKPADERVSVVEGDLATANDADRIARAGAPVVQINTGAVCHLDAHMLGHALERLELAAGATLFVENVGNLVCPAMFDLGAHERLVAFSITEGEDKPLKYPHMFACATAVVLTKLDLAPHLDVDLDLAEANVRKVAPRATVLRVSARSGEGMERLRAWVHERAAAAARASRGGARSEPAARGAEGAS